MLSTPWLIEKKNKRKKEGFFFTGFNMQVPLPDTPIAHNPNMKNNEKTKKEQRREVE
jgi:hypothetical protein